MAMWDGRFKKEIDARTNDFNSSIRFDYKMYEEDIQGSIAHAEMLASQNIISEQDKNQIIDQLCIILEELKQGKLEFDLEAEDIHMFIEEELTKRIGSAGKKLHTARSRNDQVALDIRMYLKKEVKVIQNLLIDLIKEYVKKADEHLNTVMPGYTHLQRAQPITFAHHLMAYVEMFKRDYDRLSDAYRRINILPLGSCALAGTTYPLDRDLVKDKLSFDSITNNSIDGVSDRDFCIETAAAISMIMMHLSRFSEEIILWCSWEFKFIELDDAFSTGSSIMPQKKNPDITELIRGKTGRVYGNLMTLLTMMKGLPLAYNKDMQEDKEAIFDSIDNVKMCIQTIIPMISTMKVIKENMKKAAQDGFINATDCADYLVKKGLPFRDAYKIVGTIVSYCIDEHKTLETLTLKEYKDISSIFEDDIYESIDLINCVNLRNVVGGPAPKRVKEHIDIIHTWLNHLS